VPSLRRVLTLGPVPEELAEVGVDLMAAAAAYPPQPLQVARKCIYSLTRRMSLRSVRSRRTS